MAAPKKSVASHNVPVPKQNDLKKTLDPLFHIHDVNGLAESFVDLMVRNWYMLSTWITAKEHVEKIAIRRDNYCLDFFDQLNIFRPDPDPSQGGRLLCCNCRIIQRIPVLSTRPDINWQVLQALERMQSHLLRMFMEYHRVVVKPDDGLSVFQPPFDKFRTLPVAHKIAAVARLRARIPPTFQPRLTPTVIPLDWGSRNCKMDVGVVRVLGQDNIQIVTFAFRFENGAEFTELAQACKVIRRVPNAFDLNPAQFEVWCLQDIPRAKRTLLSFFTPDHGDVAEDADEKALSPVSIEHWSYRPIDFADTFTSFPMHVDTWYPMDYFETRELVSHWGVHAILIIRK
ncbi:hypothetical protein F5Y12DRAFT_481873 [Xylaria sp. FL1777]|nr:hypothetical protein F5Y12DRAFT_481873 [Xylaria sp. FL1777]